MLGLARTSACESLDVRRSRTGHDCRGDAVVVRVLAYSGLRFGDQVSVPTAQVDVAPTLLQIAGIPNDPQTLGLQVDGRSLLGAIDNEVSPRPIVLEEHTPATPSDPGR